MGVDQKMIRCAIYTRKSLEEGLDQEFNTLDAQREAGEAYILSQKANGWVCLPEHYDDGGFSGGNVNRPALKRLLNDCENGLIDVVVTYKIDRLSRSICDFADITKNFEKWGIQFVAVTQEINTATSAGRMMLNILVTFAQFEREVIAERIRDKAVASRKKGKWIGGTVIYGYDTKDKKLEINPQESAVVQRIYQRFIEIQSPKLIARELNADGILTKQKKKWDTGHVYRILNNHTYVGEIKFQGNIYPGEQKAIVSREVWDRTRTIVAANNPWQDRSRKQSIFAPLKGILQCGHCHGAMIPTYGCYKKRKHFYYLCSKDSIRAERICPVHQIPAADIEEIVKKQIQKLLCEPGVLSHIAGKCGLSPVEILKIFQKEFWENITPGEMNRLIQLLLEKVVIWEDKLEIEFKTLGVKTLIEELRYE